MSTALLLIAGAAVFGGVPTDTTVVLGSHRIDLTGDGEPELMQVLGVGKSVDSLDVTFVITSRRDTLLSDRLRPIDVRRLWDWRGRARRVANLER